MLDTAIIEVSPVLVGVVPIAIGLVQFVVKRLIPERWIPVGALAVGVLLSMLAMGELTGNSIVQGLAIGLIAMGVYSGTKTTING